MEQIKFQLAKEVNDKSRRPGVRKAFLKLHALLIPWAMLIYYCLRQ